MRSTHWALIASAQLMALLAGSVIPLSEYENALLASNVTWLHVIVLIALVVLAGLHQTHRSAIALAISIGSLLAGHALIHYHLKVATQVKALMPVACHSQKAALALEFNAQSYLPNGRERWIAETLDDHPCLKAGSQIQLNIDRAEREGYGLSPGTKAQFEIKLKSLRAPLQLEGFDVHAWWASKGLSARGEILNRLTPIEDSAKVTWLHRVERWQISITDRLIAQLSGRSIGNDQAGLIVAMVTGDQGLIGGEERSLYADTGIAHLVAVSGLHITLFVGLVGWAVARLWRLSPRCRSVCTPLVAGSMTGLFAGFLFAVVAGFGIPAQRTIAMTTLVVLIKLRNPMAPWSSSFFPALCLTMATQPFCVQDAGFWLSFGAVGLLVYGEHGLLRIAPSRYEWAIAAVRAQWRVTLGLTVPLACLFNQISVVGPLVNALSIPWMSFICTPLVVLGGLTGLRWPIWLAAQCLEIQHHWLTWAANLTHATVLIAQQPWWVYMMAGIGTVLLLLPNGVGNKALGLALTGLIFLPSNRPPLGEMRVIAHDVGQGSALAILTRHHTLIVDTGPPGGAGQDPGTRVLIPWLKHQGIRALDALIISHDDNDHTGGAASLLRWAKPTELMSSLHATHPLVQQHTNEGRRHINCHQQAPWTWDGVAFIPLALSKAFLAKATDNNQSCVLKIVSSSGSVLIAGDVEKIAEDDLLLHHQDELKSDVLIAPHHGSNTSSSALFLAAVAPSLVIIQSGWKNRYRHPADAVLNRLTEQGIPFAGTAQFGAIELGFNTNGSVHLRCAIKERLKPWHLHETGATMAKVCQ